jgi:hypothetical protein
MPRLAVHHLTPAETLRDLHLVPGHQESSRLINADLHVVRIDLHGASKTDLLHFGGLGRRPILALLLGELVLVLPVIHDLAHGRTRVGDNLDEVEPLLLRHAHRLERLDDADLLVVRADHADRRDTDHVVHAGPLDRRAGVSDKAT